MKSKNVWLTSADIPYGFGMPNDIRVVLANYGIRVLFG